MSSTINQDAILSGKVSTQEMLLSGKVTTLETLIGPPGPQGPKGDPGDSYTVKGLYATLSALQSAHPTGSAGDAWFVGTSENNVVYQWDVDQSAWVNVGVLKGPKGDTGEDGVRGLGWYQDVVTTSTPQIYMWTVGSLAPKWGEGDWLYDPDNGNVGLCTSRTDKADGSGSASITYKGTLKGTDGITPHIGENGNWYIGDTDTGVSADGSGNIFKVIVVDGTGGPDTLSADKTFAEIKSAYTDGNIVVVLHESALYELTYMGNVRAEFTRVNETYYEVMSCTNSGAPQEVDIWQLNRTKRLNYDTKYRDIGLKTVPVAIKELQDKSAPAVTDTDAGKYLHVNSSTNELEWAAAESATHETAGIVKPSADFDIAEDGTLSLYKDIAVNSLTLNKDTVYEIGSTVTGLDTVWVLNKTPAEQTITVSGATGSEDTVIIAGIGADVRSTTALTGSAATQWNGVKTQEKTSGTLTVALTVKDNRGAAASKTASIHWFNGVYTGSAEAPTTIDSAFILTLTKSLQSGKGKTFTVNAATVQYIWYACPVRYGTPNFNVGGFDGGFSLTATFDFTNSSGYTEEYQVWRSDNAGLGGTTVKVS